MKTLGIVVAGGSGSRFGAKKQYLKLNGRSVWQRSVDVLMSAHVNQLWVVVPSVDVADVKIEVEQVYGTAEIHVVAGGVTRHGSVLNALTSIADVETLSSEQCILIHDAARPFVARTDVLAVIQTATKHGAAILAEPCRDTLKRVEETSILETVPRDDIWLAQTPQVFRADWIWQAVSSGRNEVGVTDEASLMEQMGYMVHVVEASQPNLKITTTLDREYALWLARQRWGEDKS